jgi:hypothetical protein
MATLKTAAKWLTFAVVALLGGLGAEWMIQQTTEE